MDKETAWNLMGDNEAENDAIWAQVYVPVNAEQIHDDVIAEMFNND